VLTAVFDSINLDRFSSSGRRLMLCCEPFDWQQIVRGINQDTVELDIDGLKKYGYG
jgi:hypothetical protein